MRDHTEYLLDEVAFLQSCADTFESEAAPESFAHYVDAVFTLTVEFIHLSQDLFAVQGWSRQKGEGTVRSIILETILYN